MNAIPNPLLPPECDPCSDLIARNALTSEQIRHALSHFATGARSVRHSRRTVELADGIRNRGLEVVA